MKKLVLVFVGVLTFSFAEAQQDRHFSMFFANPVLTNPGAAGHGLGTFQLFTNFRTQWFTLSNQSFRSFSASFDSRILDKAIDNGFIGLGANMINDVSGDGKYTVNVIQIPLNYTLEIGENSYLSLGLQPGMYMQTLNEDALYFDSQWTGAGFDPGLSSGESLGAFNVSRFDLGAGIYYNAFLKDNFNLQLGVGGLHLTGQKISFYNISENLYRHFNFQGIAHIWPENQNLSFHPAIYGQAQGPNFEIIVGNNFEYALKPVSQHTGFYDGMALSFGLYYRVGDAIIGNIIYKAGPLAFGVSYDANLSGLSPATNGVGAVEAFLRFNPSIKPKFGTPSLGRF
ncbi:MAG: PorP/SprF family type IX secretion system membrane protein [Crocinitomicaceae bacterium]|nr:PorP/SprF family type IX secretion system membrane protein [Crocinitomicaceae bacterium]